MNIKKYFLLFFTFFLGSHLQAEQKNDVIRSLTDQEISIYKDSINLYKNGALTKTTLNALLSKYNISLKGLYRILLMSKELLVSDVSKKWKYNILYGTVAISSFGGVICSGLTDMFAGIFAMSIGTNGSLTVNHAILKKIRNATKYFYTFCLGALSFDSYKWYRYNASINAKKQEIETIDIIIDQLKFNA